jgi:hypothetical protein
LSTIESHKGRTLHAHVEAADSWVAGRITMELYPSAISSRVVREIDRATYERLTGTAQIDLATHLARAIFAVGDEADDKVRRIQFRGGTDAKETDLGGFCEDALVKCIRDALWERGVQS